MRQEDRVVRDVIASQVEQPGDVIQGRHQVPLDFTALHFLTQRTEVLLSAAACPWSVQFADAASRQARAILPDHAGKVEVQCKPKFGSLASVPPLTPRLHGQHVAVYRNALALGQALS